MGNKGIGRSSSRRAPRRKTITPHGPFPDPALVFIFIQPTRANQIMKNNTKKKTEVDGKYIGIGIIVGVIFGAVTDNYGLGIALGLAIGVAVGVAVKKREKSDDSDGDET